MTHFTSFLFTTDLESFWESLFPGIVYLLLAWCGLCVKVQTFLVLNFLI